MSQRRHSGRLPTVGAVTVAGLALAAGASFMGATRDSAAVAAAVPGPCGTSTTPPARFDHVVLVVLENKHQDQIFTGSQAPYLQSLAAACGRGTNMRTVDPDTSLPNYIALTSGYTGHPVHITHNRGPKAWPQDTVSIMEQLGTDWRAYSENMPSNCFAGRAYDFTVNHNPAPYYTRIADTTCETNNMPMPATPNLSKKLTLLVPNKVHIMHQDDAPGTTTLAQRIRSGDTWAGDYLPKVFASPEYQAGNMVVIITFDEGNQNRTDVPFIVASPSTPVGYRTAAALNHYGTLKGMQEMLGLTPLLGHAADADTVSIRRYFGLS